MSIYLKYKTQFIWFGITLLIVLAVFIGKNLSQQSQFQIIRKHFPESRFHLKQENPNKWIVNDINTYKESIVYQGEGIGYNGVVSILVQVGKDGIIQSAIPAVHQETPSYYKKIRDNRFFEEFTEKKIAIFLSDNPVDIISGATITSNAILEAIQNGYSLGEDIPVVHTTYPLFGILEYIILYLFLAGFLVAKIKNSKLKSVFRWSSIFISLVFLGFIYNQPISYSRLSALFLGNFPNLHKEFYFYILLGGSFFFVLTTRKNIYCHSVCPFGAAQEILAKTGKAKPFRPGYYKNLKFIQRSIALVIILLSLVLNNPVIANYEVFSAFFQLTANMILFSVLFIVIILSLFIKRPWCHFMCPIDSTFEYFKLTRNLISSLWKK